MRLYDFHCSACELKFEALVMGPEFPDCPGCQSTGAVTRAITAPKAYIMRSASGSSSTPKRFNNYEPRRKEAKRERVTGMLERQGLSEKNNTHFLNPSEARKR